MRHIGLDTREKECYLKCRKKGMVQMMNGKWKRALALGLVVLLLLTGCGGEAKKGGEDVKLQASGSSEAKPSERESGASGSEESTSEATESTEDLTEGSEATEGSSSASTEASTKPTEQQSQPTAPTATEPPHQHSYTETVVAPTCNDKGYTLHSCSCGHSYKDGYTAALGHHFVDEVIAPTSTEQGYTKHTCDRCWYSYNDTYTDPVKVVYDINAAMEAGNAYALSIGFGYIDYSLTPANAGYYPCGYVTGDTLSRIGGQEWLNQEMKDAAQDTANCIDGTLGRDGHNCSCRAYITYDAATDTYTTYFLYA